MRKMTSELNDKNMILNVSKILDEVGLEDLPHYSTINNYLERLEPSELEEVVQKMTMSLLNMKEFKKGLYRGKYCQLVVDGSKLFSTDEEHSEGSLFKVHRDKEKNIAKVEYYYYILEAKSVLPGKIVVSVLTVFCKNDEGLSPYDEDNESQEKKKQDCELKAFYRMAEDLKKLFGKTKLCLTMDSLYAGAPVFELCKRSDWRYIIRFKDGSIKSIADAFEKAVKEKPHRYNKFKVNEDGEYEFLNMVLYKGQYLNVVRYTENYEKNKQKYPFVFITNLPINTKNCVELVARGRARWNIENQGFNMQKNHGYELTHKFSLDYKAIQNHYFLIQIAHAISQIFESQIDILKELKMTIFEIHERIKNDFKCSVIDVQSASLESVPI